jgi:chemotaxis protein CheD
LGTEVATAFETLPVRWTRRGPEPVRATGRIHEAYLPPGQKVASAEPCLVTTILGSCVAVCLTDRGAGVGGVNHFLLPQRVSAEQSLRFGQVAIPSLVDAVVALGARRARLVAKVFGGAQVLRPWARGGDHLGAQNVSLALLLLKDLGIPVVAQDVNGDRGRKLRYHTADGTAWVKRL